MTGDRRNDDAFDNFRDGAADDDEFILELDDVTEGVVAPWLAKRLAPPTGAGDELLDVMGDDDFEVEPPGQAARHVATPTRPSGLGAPIESAAGSLLDDFEIELAAVDPTASDVPGPGLLQSVSFDATDATDFADDDGVFDDEAKDFVLVDGAPEPGADGELALDPADMLFEDTRDAVAPTSAFGADLGPPFGHRRDFQMPELEVEFGARSLTQPTTEVEAFEVEVDFDESDGAIASSDEEDHWQEQATGDEFEVADQLSVTPDFAAHARPSEPERTVRADFGMQESTREIRFAADADDDASEADWLESDADDPATERAGDEFVDDVEASDEYDAIYGENGADAAESPDDDRRFAPADSTSIAEPDYSDHEVAYADATVGSSGEVVGTYDGGRRKRWRLIAGLAAFVPIAAAGVLAFVFPDRLQELTGPSRAQPQRVAIVDRVMVERPTVNVQVEFPAVALAATPVTTTPLIEPTDTGERPVLVDLEPRTPPSVVAADPARPTTQVEPSELAQGSPVPTLEPQENQTADPVVRSTASEPSTDWRAEFMAAGDLLIANDIGADPQNVPAIARDLRAGAQAFARLHNGSFFTGLVTRIEESTISIATETGVVTFPYADLQALTPLASADMRQLVATERGFVRLQNRARLFGAILRNDDRSITLSEKDGVITVPAWQIDRVGLEAPGGIEILEDGEDDWLRARARTRLDQRASVPVR